MTIKKEDLRKIWSEVKLNRAKLMSCHGPHKFTIDTTPDKKFGKRSKCELCHGVIDSINKEWYELGLKHAS